jgi:hypothetical protein
VTPDSDLHLRGARSTDGIVDELEVDRAADLEIAVSHAIEVAAATSVLF